MAKSSGKARSSICLVMIVKDEAAVVGEALASLAPHVADYVVVDTGSSDGTQALITGDMAARGVGGQVFDRPWRDFGWNRSEALALAREHSASDYLWMFDADDLLEGRPELGRLSADGYQLRIGPDFEYWRTQLFRRDLPWKFVGVLHEYPSCDDREPELGRIEGDYWVVSRRLGSRSRDPDKYAKDAAILEAALEAEPDNARHAFYLAQSWYDAGRFDKALEAYTRRVGMPGWPEETFYARYRQAACLHQLGRPLDEVLEAYEACFRAFPHRAEPLVRAATLARGAERFAEAYVLARRAVRVPRPGPNALFVDALDYEFRALDEQAISAFYCGFPEEAFELCTELLDHRALPDSDRPRIETNR
ncbi:MAG TPA: glycosyltransferase, partial [Caulobacteraceae bacterium]